MPVNPFPAASQPEIDSVVALADELPLSPADSPNGEHDTAVVGVACFAASHLQDPVWAGRLFVSAMQRAGMRRAVEYMTQRVYHEGRGDAALYDMHVSIFGERDVPLAWSSAAADRRRLQEIRDAQTRRRERERQRKHRAKESGTEPGRETTKE